MVKEGDIVAEFDRTFEEERAREALAKYDDLQHKLRQRQAENLANAKQRAEAMEQAKADLEKARIQLRIAAVLPEIERLQNEVRLKDALARVSSLETSHSLRLEADEASLRLLEIQSDRQKRALERAQNNAEQLVVRAPHEGMVAHEYVYRGNTRGPPQIGDQLYRGYPLLRIFDPSEMEIVAQVGEPDGEVLVPGARAVVMLDAYPDLSFPARLRAASPVAASGYRSPIRQFEATFTLEEMDPHILPDLSVAVVILDEKAGGGAAR
jgi:multidrug resistance efflux pump